MAALVITMFLVGTVAAMKQVCEVPQRENFCEDSAVQGTGYIWYDKTILDKSIAVDVHEHMEGDTGHNGSFAMTIYEELDEGVRLNATGGDPIQNASFDSFKCSKMVQFESFGGIPTGGYVKWDPIVADYVAITGLEGQAVYESPGFHGGLGAKVIEGYAVTSMQKDEETSMKTTALYKNGPPYNAQQLKFSTKNAFEGNWGTTSTWKKVCTKNIRHEQFFAGTFQVDKTLVFKEEVTVPCPPDKCLCGDC